MLRLLKFCCVFWLAAIAIVGLVVPSAMAGDRIASTDTTEVRVSLGNEAGALKFFPNEFEFVAGRTYKLVLRNPSPEKHYFTSKDFADVSWTRKVEASGVEVKGAIRELELKPGATAEWVFVPEKPGVYDLECTIAGHAEAGMTGTIAIVSPQERG